MTVCDETIASAVRRVAADWSCTPLEPDKVLVTTSYQYSDGDHVELLVRLAGGDVIVSDGGQTLARLDLAGVNLEAGRARQMWHSLIRAHELDFDRGRLLLRGPVRDAGSLVTAMANALTNLDAVRLLAPAPRAPRFAEQLVTFLQSEFEFVEERPELRGRSGMSFRITAAIGDRKMPTYVQAVSGGSFQTRQRAIEHTFTLFADVNGSLPVERKLAVLGGEAEVWRPEQIRLLTPVAYVGNWNSRERISQFVAGHPPKGDRLLLDRHELEMLQLAHEDES